MTDTQIETTDYLKYDVDLFNGKVPRLDLETYYEYCLNKLDAFSSSAPIYIPSKGRAGKVKTHKLFDNHHHFIVVEPQDYEFYRQYHNVENLLVMDYNDKGISYARNFIKNHAKQNDPNGRHWQIDDDFSTLMIRKEKKNCPHEALPILGLVEHFCSLYKNIGIANIIHFAYAFAHNKHIYLNRFGYGCVLLKNSAEPNYVDECAEDLTMSMMLLEEGYVTMTFNHLLFSTPSSGTQEGGNMMNNFKDDNRLRIFENTIQMWPDIFCIERAISAKGHRLGRKKNPYKMFKQRPILNNKGLALFNE